MGDPRTVDAREVGRFRVFEFDRVCCCIKRMLCTQLYDPGTTIRAGGRPGECFEEDETADWKAGRTAATFELHTRFADQ